MRVFLFLVAASACVLWATTWGSWNGITVGTSAGNVSKWDGGTIGTAAGNIGSLNGLISPSGGGGGITLVVQSALVRGTTNPATAAANCTGATLLTAVFSHDFSNGGFNGDGVNVWHNLTDYSNSDNVNSVQLEYAYSAVGGGALTGLASISVNATANSGSSLMFSCWSGTKTDATVLDTSVGNGCSPNCTTVQAGSITPAGNGELFYFGMNGAFNDTDSIDSSFIGLQGSSSGLGNGGDAYLIQSTAAAVNPTWTGSGVTRKVASMAAFKPGP